MKKQKTKPFGQCQLCVQEKELISKSHIIPKFFLKRTLNKENEGFAMMSFDTSESKHVPDAGYESGILCAACDGNILGGYEDYGSKFLYGSLGKKEILEITPGGIHFEVQNVNYQKLKLFVLSLLWKFSISKTFGDVTLDADSQEILRKVLFNNEQLSEGQFPIILWNYAHVKDIPNEFILPPWIGSKSSGEQNFHFLGGGIFIQIILNYEDIDEMSQEAMLKESGSIKIISAPPESLKKLINRIVGWNWFK